MDFAVVSLTVDMENDGGKNKLFLLHTSNVTHMADPSENEKKKKESKYEAIENLFLYKYQ